MWIYKITYRVCVDIDVHSSDNKKHQNVLDGLNIQLRSLSYFRFHESLSIEQISGIMDISEDTVRQYLKEIEDILTAKSDDTVIETHSYVDIDDVSPVESIVESDDWSETSASKPISVQKSKTNPILLKIKKKANSNNLILIGLILISCYFIYSLLFPPARHAVIQKIEYNSKFTNQDLELNIITSNQNYDDIYINDRKTTVIYENGEYTVQLMKDGKIVNRYTIHVDNIDKTAPSITNIQYYEYKTILYFQESGSGIDESSIRYFDNEVESKEYEYDATQRALKIPHRYGHQNRIYVSDRVGNKMRFDIKF